MPGRGLVPGTNSMRAGSQRFLRAHRDEPLLQRGWINGGIAVPGPVLSCRGDQVLDFVGGQVFAEAALGLRNGTGRNCPILRGWRGGLGLPIEHGF